MLRVKYVFLIVSVWVGYYCDITSINSSSGIIVAVVLME